MGGVKREIGRLEMRGDGFDYLGGGGGGWWRERLLMLVGEWGGGGGGRRRSKGEGTLACLLACTLHTDTNKIPFFFFFFFSSSF